MRGNILHISTNDKFLNSTIYQFEKVFSGKNTFRILPKSNNEQLGVFDSAIDIEMVHVDVNTFIEKENIVKYDLIVLHGLNSFMNKLVLKLKKNVNFLWILWGAEIYNDMTEPLGCIYGDYTKKKFKIKTTSNPIINFLKYIKYKLSYNKDILETQKAIKNIKYIGIIHREDFELMKRKKLLRNDAQWIKFSYYPIEFIFKGIENLRVNNNNILIGNSAYPSNNHIEVFDILKKIDLSDNKIVVPLSYGDPEYKIEIIKIGKNIFKDTFEPLTDFLPLIDYQLKTQGCGIVIMNNYRQQAVGNILSMLWMGAKVYLDERNTFYHYLKRIGITVFLLKKDLNVNNKEALVMLNENEIKRNREILSNEISKNKLLNELKIQLNEIIY